MKFSDYMKKEIENLSDDLILSGADKNIKSKNSESIIIGPKKNSIKNIISVAACAVFAVAIAGALLILPGVLPALDTKPADTGTEGITNNTLTLGEGIFATADGLYNYYLEDGKAVIIRYAGTEESITLPTEVDGHEVLRIEAYCIEDNTLIRKEKGDFEFTNYNIYPDNAVTIELADPNLPDAPYSNSTPDGFISQRKNQGIIVGTPVKHVTVPGTVEVGECAFQDCRNLVSVEILEGVYSVGGSAFAYCEENLVSVLLPSSLSKIEPSAFYRCHSLKEITIPGNVKRIDTEAFAGCVSLEKLTLEEGVETIGYMAFSSCYSLTEVTIPKSVTMIDYGAFEDCTNLKTVNFKSKESVLIIEGAFRNSGWNQDSSTLHTSEDGLYTYYVTSGSAVIIRYHGTEKSVTIPTVIDGINVSKVEGFAYTSEDEPITALTPWGSNTRGIFYKNPNVEEVTVPGTVEIGEGAFSNNNIKKATLGEGITTINHYAFDSCIYLSEVNIPESVTFLGAYAFNDCKAITEIEVPAGVEILAGTFWGCENLVSVKLNEGLKQIESAFAYCYALQKITIPASVEMIYTESFNFCTSLSEVVFLGENTDYEEYAFRNTPYAMNTGTDIIFTSEDGLYNYYLDGSSAVIVKYIGTDEKITIPTSLDGYTVSMLEGHSLYYDGTIEKKTDYDLNQPIVLGILTDSKVRSVTIPASVTIGECAFQGSPELENVTIEKGAISIRQYAFSNCDKLKEITLPDNLYGIGDYAFRDCNALTTVNLGRGLTTIHPYAFYRCDSLKEIVLPETVTSVGTKAFYGCSSLENVKYDHNTVSVDAYAFGETPFGKAMGFSEVSVDISRLNREDIVNIDCYIEGADNAFISEDGKYRYMVKDGGAYISRYLGDEETVVIPDVIDGYPVIMLEGYLHPLLIRDGDNGGIAITSHGIFYGRDVKEVILSKTIKIGKDAFTGFTDGIKITRIDT